MIRVYLSGAPVHDRVLRAFYDGCDADKQLVDGWKYEPSDVAVIFGVYKSRVPASYPRGDIFRRQRYNNRDVIVLETGYVNRGDGEDNHYAAGFNGLNGRADFRNKGMPGDRSTKLREMHALNCRRWREDGEHVLLCGQVPWDAAVDHVDHISWLHHAGKMIRKKTDRPVRFRPHPLARIPNMPHTEYSTAPLAEDLINAHAVVTFNSNSGVEAAIAGVPVFAFDLGSMATLVANIRWDQLTYPVMPERDQWLDDLAYTQWTPAEMAQGLAWKHLHEKERAHA